MQRVRDFRHISPPRAARLPVAFAFPPSVADALSFIFRYARRFDMMLCAAIAAMFSSSCRADEARYSLLLRCDKILFAATRRARSGHQFSPPATQQAAPFHTPCHERDAAQECCRFSLCHFLRYAAAALLPVTTHHCYAMLLRMLSADKRR